VLSTCCRRVVDVLSTCCRRVVDVLSTCCRRAVDVLSTDAGSCTCLSVLKTRPLRGQPPEAAFSSRRRPERPIVDPLKRQFPGCSQRSGLQHSLVRWSNSSIGYEHADLKPAGRGQRLAVWGGRLFPLDRVGRRAGIAHDRLDFFRRLRKPTPPAAKQALSASACQHGCPAISHPGSASLHPARGLPVVFCLLVVRM
jgi:hypothetical protein